jgi:hypothetical protein
MSELLELLPYLSVRERVELDSLLSPPTKTLTPPPDGYVNSETGKRYTPHSDEEREFVFSDGPRYGLIKGGEGSGKSVAGVIKDLERVRRGMSGILVSPDLPHFRKSLWPEFRRWCPWEWVVPEQRYRKSFSWEPHEPFILAFLNGVVVLCGGIENPISWEGPNVTWAHMDEARRAKNAAALKVLDGRVRIAGPGAEPPALWLTTTPKRNWLYEYFGPEGIAGDESHTEFKNNMRVITLRTIDNEQAGNLAPGYTAQRRNSLTSEEADQLLEAGWGTASEGVVYATFNEDNVTTGEPDPEQPIELAVDDGYIDPRAILFIQRTSTRVLVFDELYHSKHLEEVCVREAIDRCAKHFGYTLMDPGKGQSTQPITAAQWAELPPEQQAQYRITRLPEIAVGSPEAKALQVHFRRANIPMRGDNHMVVEGIKRVRRLICDGQGVRTLKVHIRCRNLLSELTEGYVYPETGTKSDDEKPLDGNDHACEALRHWVWLRGRGG